MQERNGKKGLALLLALVLIFTTVWIPIPVQAASVTISQKSLTLTVGETKKLKVSTTLKGKITWKSSNKKVATVSSKGKVTGKAPGTARITAKIKGKKATCKVTVKKIGLKAQAKKNAKTYKKQIKAILGYTNQYRNQAGTENLKLDAKLTKAACYRSLEMAKAKKLSHERPDGTSCFTILSFYGAAYHTAGENIAYTKGYGISPKTVSEMWYNSPGHKANMLNAGFKKIGIGIAVADDGSVYYTQLFTD